MIAAEGGDHRLHGIGGADTFIADHAHHERTGGRAAILRASHERRVDRDCLDIVDAAFERKADHGSGEVRSCFQKLETHLGECVGRAVLAVFVYAVKAVGTLAEFVEKDGARDRKAGGDLDEGSVVGP